MRAIHPFAGPGQGAGPQSLAQPPADLPDPVRLPPELAFLQRHGFAPEGLAQAAARAAHWACPPEQALFVLELARPADYYRALAAELRLPFQEEGIAAGPGTRFPESIAAGIVPLAAADGEARFALAPQGFAVARLLAGAFALPPDRVVITTPAALQAAVLAHAGATIARQAADGLVEQAPALSCKHGATGAQRAAAGLGIAAGLACLALAPVLFLVANGLVFLSMVVLRLGVCFERPALPGRAGPARRIPDADLPTYTIIVPLHREAGVVARLTRALKRLDYPPAKLDIKLVIEADDAETRRALDALDLPPPFETIVAPDGLPRTKPRALNVALPLARGAFTTIYDAEDVPEPAQLRQAVAGFAQAAPDVACLQARLAIDNPADSPLALCFALEYAGLFDVVNPGLARLGLPVPLGGTSNHFRTAVLREALGWDAWNVTEDADLGIRLARMGLKVGDLASTTYEEAPPALHGWMAQRTRWMKGFMQVLITHTRNPAATVRDLGAYRAWVAFTLIFGTLASALGFPLFSLLLAVELADGALLAPSTTLDVIGSTMAVILSVFGLLAMLAPPVLGARRRGWREGLPFVAALPAYYSLVSLAAWRAVAELARSPAQWNKTQHGVALSSRSGALTGSDGARLPPRPVAASG